MTLKTREIKNMHGVSQENGNSCSGEKTMNDPNWNSNKLFFRFICRFSTTNDPLSVPSLPTLLYHHYFEIEH